MRPSVTLSVYVCVCGLVLRRALSFDPQLLSARINQNSSKKVMTHSVGTSRFSLEYEKGRIVLRSNCCIIRDDEVWRSLSSWKNVISFHFDLEGQHRYKELFTFFGRWKRVSSTARQTYRNSPVGWRLTNTSLFVVVDLH